MVIQIRKIVGPFLRLLAPGYSWCSSCGWPWRFAEPHLTRYTEDSSCFPLCECCWKRLTIEQRIPHYWGLAREWDRWTPGSSSELGPLMEDAVQRGL